MARKRTSARKRGRRRGIGAYIAAVALVAVLAGVVGISTFFKISVIQVEGVSVYSPEEIIAVSGLEMGDNLFFVRDNATVLRIREQLVYVENVKILKNYPGTVTLQITEAFPIASVYTGGSLWLFDKNGKLLENIKSVSREGSIAVTGIEPILPTVGSKIALGEENATKEKYLLDILAEFERLGIHEKITALDMENITAIVFDYDGRFRVNLGTGDNPDVKLQLLLKVVGEKDADASGAIDLSVEGEAHFVPD